MAYSLLLCLHWSQQYELPASAHRPKGRKPGTTDYLEQGFVDEVCRAHKTLHASKRSRLTMVDILTAMEPCISTDTARNYCRKWNLPPITDCAFYHHNDPAE